jgi:hypothetical protein
VIKGKKGVLLFSHVVNGSTRIYAPTKPPGNSHLMTKESEDLKNKVSQLKNQANNLNHSMLKMLDFSCPWENLKR